MQDNLTDDAFTFPAFTVTVCLIGAGVMYAAARMGWI